MLKNLYGAWARKDPWKLLFLNFWYVSIWPYSIMHPKEHEKYSLVWINKCKFKKTPFPVKGEIEGLVMGFEQRKMQIAKIVAISIPRGKWRRLPESKYLGEKTHDPLLHVHGLWRSGMRHSGLSEWFNKMRNSERNDGEVWEGRYYTVFPGIIL